MMNRETFKKGTKAYYVPSYDVVIPGIVTKIYTDGIFRNITIKTTDGFEFTDSDNLFSNDYPTIVNYR